MRWNMTGSGVKKIKARGENSLLLSRFSSGKLYRQKICLPDSFLARIQEALHFWQIIKRAIFIDGGNPANKVDGGWLPERKTNFPGVFKMAEEGIHIETFIIKLINIYNNKDFFQSGLPLSAASGIINNSCGFADANSACSSASCGSLARVP